MVKSKLGDEFLLFWKENAERGKKINRVTPFWL